MPEPQGGLMRLTEITYSEARPIDGYGPGFFRVGWGGLDDAATPLALADRIDVLFVGTGAEIAHLPAGFRRTLEEAGIGVEVMNSPAACRTYNVLLSEGRRIAVALLPV